MRIGREVNACHAMAELGLRLATPRDIAEGHGMATRLVGPRIATLDTMLRVQARARCAIFTMRSGDGDVVGAISVIPLATAARGRLAAGDFDGLDPADEMVARRDEAAIAFYGWGMAGLTHRARAAVIAAAVKFQRKVYGPLPFYARAATSEGERVLHNRMGARPLPGPGGMVSAPPWLAATQRRAA